MARARWKPDPSGVEPVWHRLDLPGGRFVAICAPRTGGLCRQWFVCLCDPSGVVVEDTHTPLARGEAAWSERRAKGWARRWAAHVEAP